jgi:hypothetical protein
MRAIVGIRIAAAVGLAAMLAVIVWASVTASFGEDGSTLLELAWGRVTLVDLYLSLLLGWAWIAWREGSVARALLWLVAIVTTGSVALLGYVVIASLRTDSVPGLLVGARAGAPPALQAVPTATEGEDAATHGGGRPQA